MDTAQDLRLPVRGSATLRVVKSWQIAVVVFLLVAALAIGIVALVRSGVGTTPATAGANPRPVPTHVAPNHPGQFTGWHDDQHGTPQCPQCR